MFGKLALSLFSALSLYLGCAAVAAAGCPGGAPVAGVVEAVSGARGGILVTRGGETISPVVALPLCAGDQVNASGPGSVLHVRLADGQARDIRGGGDIPDPGGSNIMMRSMEEKFAALAPLFSTYGRSMVGRGSERTPFEFTCDSVGAAKARVSSAWPAITLRWRGGVGPYSMVIRRPGDAPPISTADIQDKQVRVDVGHLEPGLWQVSIKDLVGAELQGGFVVDPARAPPALAPDGPFSELDDALTAVSVASEPDLAFEAEQVLGSAPLQGLDRAPVYNTITCRVSAAHHRDLCGVAKPDNETTRPGLR